MNRVFAVALFIVSSNLALSGCVGTIPVWKCDTAKWAEIGARDGSYGFSKERQLKYYTSQCEIDAFTNTLDDYSDGHDRGVLGYCTYVTGYKVGKKYKAGSYDVKHGDHEYKSVCPESHESVFLLGYMAGIETNLAIKNERLENAKRTLLGARTSLLSAQRFLPNPVHREFIQRVDSEQYLQQYGDRLEQEALSAEKVVKSAEIVSKCKQEVLTLMAVRNKWKYFANGTAE